MSTFSADLASFARLANESLDKIVREVAEELGSAIIKSTPRDTGRAMGNWQTTTGTPAADEIDRTGETGALAELKQNVGGVGTVTYITNNLPYIMRLEQGWSDQSPPYAMVRGNMARIQQNIAEAVRKNKV